MQFKVIVVGLASAAVAAAQSLTINTPTSLIQCVPALIQWSGGTAPYYVYANQGGSTSQILETLVNAGTSTSYTWTVDLAAGTSVTLAVRDSTGAQNFAQQVTIQAGSSTSCSSSSGSSAAAGATSSGSASSSSAASSTSAASSSSTTAPTSTRASSTTAAASSTSSRAATTTTSAAANAAPSKGVNAGAALAVAAVAAAFL